MKKALLVLLFFPILSPGQSVLEAPINEAEKTKIMILATPHLSAYKEDFQPGSLEKLLSRLESWGPNIICVESLSPLSMQTAISNPDLYSEVVNQFGANLALVGNYFQEDQDCNWQQAVNRYDSLGRRLQIDPDNQENRIGFTKYAFASYRFYTGLLQWKNMRTESKEKMKLSAQIATNLEERLNSTNEDIQIGIKLAEKLGLEELHQIDDHLDKDIFMKIAPALVTELNSNKEYEKVLQSGFYKESEKELKKGLAGMDLMPYYLAINSEEYQTADLEEQWKLFYRTNMESKLDRVRVGLWEVRNLNIASNIRRVSALYPGQKILVIIGSSHKIFLDHYLKNMMEVEIININDL